MDRVDEILFLYEDDRANMAVGGAVKAIAKRILKGKKKYDYKNPKQKKTEFLTLYVSQETGTSKFYMTGLTQLFHVVGNMIILLS